MSTHLERLPDDLPVPIDDGAAAHLVGQAVPDVTLPDTRGEPVRLGALRERWVIYVYPMTGRPGVPLPDGWDAIPGARGCTPQSCGFRDHHADVLASGADVLGVSSQSSEDQREARERLHLPFELLSDRDLRLKRTLQLPTFTVEGRELYRRLTFVVRGGRIERVFYPVFPPDRNASEVVAFLRANP